MHVLSIDVGASNYAVCACTLPEATVVRLESWNLGNTRVSPASVLVDRLLAQWQEWDLWQEGWQPDRVVIEQQMRGAHINLALAFATYTYFKMHHPTAETKFEVPAAKFRAYRACVPAVAEAFPEKPPSEYNPRKRMAVKIADAILATTTQSSLCTLCPGTKKDDLADAFLQAFCAL